MKKIISVLLILASIFCISSCAKKQSGSSESGNAAELPSDYEISSSPTNYVMIEMESGDVMVVELYPDSAPITVENFKNLVSKKYYDGTVFHRVIKNFMIQGGDGADTPSIKGEFAINGVENDIKHERGVISMARANNPNSASSQFFICHTTEKCEHLDGQYAAFGKLIYGYETLDKIATVETGYNDVPTVEQKMKSVRFVTVKISEDTSLAYETTVSDSEASTSVANSDDTASDNTNTTTAGGN